jgi:undecaprenyl pyrophosphate synthase
MNLSRWIRRRPVPHALLCDDKRIVIGDGHRRWADAVDAIFASTSESISAVAKDGSVLRVCQRADLDDLPAEDVEPANVSEHQRELAQIAQILADAYSTAHEHARENSARGYELLARFAELSFQRLAAIERAYGQLLAAHARAMETDTSSDGLDGAISGIVSRAMGGSPGGNGKKEVTP